MEATEKGIDVGGRVLDMLLAFTGDDEERNRVFFKVKGKKVSAAATAKNRAIEVEGKADEGSEDGEWPVEAGFLRNLASMTVPGSPKVPAVVARLLCERTGVSTADLVVKESGKKVDTVQHHAEMPANTQLTFSTIHKTITPNFDEPGSWYPIDKKLHGALGPVFAALGKGRPVSLVGGTDEQSPVGFQAKGEDFVVRGILIPPAVEGPGREAVDQEDDDEESGERQPDLFEQKATGTDDDSVIDDDEAERIKAEQQGEVVRGGRVVGKDEKPKAKGRKRKS